MNTDLKVEVITKSMLREAVLHNTYWKQPGVVPLPKSKATWVVANPRIEEEEYCGVMGLSGTKMVSFIFMFPDMMNMPTGGTQKVYWLLLWWVEKQYKDTVLGTYVFNEALRITQNKVLIKSYAEHVNAFYEKQPFTVITARLRHTIFFNLDTSILIGKFSFLSPFKPILHQLSRVVGWGVRLLNQRRIRKRVSAIRYEYITELDAISWQFIESLCHKDLIHKTKEYINWQLDKRQYTQLPIAKRFMYQSLQVGYGNQIDIHTLKVMKEGTMIGFISYVRNHKECNVKYFLVAEEDKYTTCVDALMEHVVHHKLNFLFTDDQKLSDAIKTRYQTIFRYQIEKKGLAHQQMQLQADQVNFYNRDGHFY